MRRAVEWLFDDSAENSERGKYPPLPAKECILIGHSVGATISFAVALALDLDAAGTNERRDRFDFVIKAIVGVEGIYDFTALRDAHVGFREIYEEFTTAALGDEGDGGWERGNVGRVVKEGKGLEGMEVVVLGQSRGDELVEWGQVEVMEGALRERGWGSGDGEEECWNEVMVIELNGGHDEMWEKGEEMARCIGLAVERCVGKDLCRGG